MTGEEPILGAISEIRTPVLNSLFSNITALGSTTFLILVLLALYLFKEHETLQKCIKTALISYPVVYSLKYLLKISRPALAIQNTLTPSFPSSHAANAFLLATILSKQRPKAKYFFFGLATLVGFSRIYLGVHYPLDVIVGGLIGILSVEIIENLEKSKLTSKLAFKITTYVTETVRLGTRSRRSSTRIRTRRL